MRYTCWVCLPQADGWDFVCHTNADPSDAVVAMQTLFPQAIGFSVEPFDATLGSMITEEK